MTGDLPLIEVACGVLQRADGQVLLAQRPEGKIAAGYWEFPGGKIEPGESADEALLRELHEELGVAVRAARPLIRLRHAYHNRIVILDTWLVTDFDGEPQSRENQALAWVALDAIAAYTTLPTVAPILKPLRLPAHYVFTPPTIDPAMLRDRLPALPGDALLRLRLPALDDRAYAALAASLRDGGRRLVLDRDPALARELDCGWHATTRAWRALRQRPDVPAFYGSAHDRATLMRCAGSMPTPPCSVRCCPRLRIRASRRWGGMVLLVLRWNRGCRSMPSAASAASTCCTPGSTAAKAAPASAPTGRARRYCSRKPRSSISISSPSMSFSTAGIVYWPLIQAPKSSSLQRSLQKGRKRLPASNKAGALH